MARRDLLELPAEVRASIEPASRPLVIAPRLGTVDRFELCAVGVMIASFVTFWFAH